MDLLGKSDCAEATPDAKAEAPSTMAIIARRPSLNQCEHSSACNMLLLLVNAMQRQLHRHAIAWTRAPALLAAVCFDAASQRSCGLAWQSRSSSCNVLRQRRLKGIDPMSRRPLIDIHQHPVPEF